MDFDEVLAFLRRAQDEQIRDAVHAFGSEEVLRLVMGGMADRFDLRPGRVPGLLVMELDDEGTLHRHGIRVTEGGARHLPDPDEESRAVLRTTMVRFLRVVVGAQDPKRLVVTGRMRLSGDVVWAVTTLASLKR